MSVTTLLAFGNSNIDISSMKMTYELQRKLSSRMLLAILRLEIQPSENSKNQKLHSECVSVKMGILHVH